MLNYFTLFSLPEAFEVSLDKLAQTYQQLQRSTHPDKFAGDSDQNQRIALQRNSQVNDGYQILKSPVKRAEHLLGLRGIEFAHETKTMQDTEFLMQQMEWRETLSDAASHDDPFDVLDDLTSMVSKEKENQLTALKQLLDTNTKDSNRRAADVVRKLKFIEKMLVEIADAEDRLDP